MTVGDDYRGGKEGNLLDLDSDPDFGVVGGREEEDVVHPMDVVKWGHIVALSRNNELEVISDKYRREREKRNEK